MKKRRKRYKLRKKYKILLIFLVCLCLLIKITSKHSKHIEKEEKPKENIVEKKIVEDEPAEKTAEPAEETAVEEQEENIQENASYEKTTSIDTSYTTRMTSFWANDGYGTGECTGSGLCSWDFDINEKGWYIWQGKLVVAAATTYLANQGWNVGSGVHLYKYSDELILTIDGIEYEAVVKDSCGNCMKTDRIDLFVSNGESERDTNIQVRRK